MRIEKGEKDSLWFLLKERYRYKSKVRRIVLESRIYYEFYNFFFTLEHYLGTPIFLLIQFLPSAALAPPYCYACRKDWFQIIEEELNTRSSIKREEKKREGN